MAVVSSAQELIRVIDPQNLEDIRVLLSGTKVDLETFSRTIRTYIPAVYSDTEEAIDALALSIVDLFEEIDSDKDGLVAWPDLIAYFIEASQAPRVLKQQLAKAQTFKSTQQSAQQYSGKTSLIVLESVLANNAQFRDVEGNSIIQVLQHQQHIYIVTNTGIYQTDTSYLFPKLIFVPDEQTIMKARNKGRKVVLSNKERERREIVAKRKLESLDFEMFGENRYQYNLNKFAPKGIKNQPITKAEIINSMKHSAINQKIDIVQACVLEPYPLMVIAFHEPIFIIISLTGNSGVSPPFNIESPISSMYWEGINRILYLGHVSGAVSAYKVNATQHQHEIMQGIEDQQAHKRLMDVQYQTQCFIEKQVQRLKEKHFKGDTQFIYDNQEFVSDLYDVLRRLDKNQLFSLNPEIKKLLLSEKELQLVQSDGTREHLVEFQNKLKELQATPEVQHLLPTNIFNPHMSIIQSHNIKPVALIKSDPEAFVRAEMQPTLKETAVGLKRFGGVQLDVSADLLVSRYIAGGTVKKIIGGWGTWEKLQEEEVFRLAVADSDGTITIIDDRVGFVTCFARLHAEGVLNVHVFGDAVISVGFKNVYMLTKEVVRQAFEGNILKVETEQLETMSSMLINGTQVISHVQEQQSQHFDTSKQKLSQADIYKTKNMIRQIPPPRPQDTILSSFQLNDIVGVVDYKYNITFFNLVTGQHISRNEIPVGGLMGMKFGESSYFSKLNYGLLPIGKYLFKIKTQTNDQVSNEQREVWKYLDTLDKEMEDKDPAGQKTSLKYFKQQYDAVGSVGSEVVAYKLNVQLQELAVVTGTFEITIYSLATGRPSRVIDLELISRQYSDDQASEEASQPKSYNLIQSTDIVLQQTENYLDIDPSNQVVVVDNPKRHKTVVQKDAMELLTKEKTYKSSLPQLLDPLQVIRTKQQTRILDLVGNRITAVSCDSKGRVMFVFGTKGVLTLYWKTGCLFDYQEVSEVGKKIIEEDLSTNIENPFRYSEKRSLLKVEQGLSDAGSKTVYCYSLNLDLNKIVKHQREDRVYQSVGQSRDVILAADGAKNYFFLNDQLNKQELLIITGASTRDYKAAPVNARILRSINIGQLQPEFDPNLRRVRKFRQFMRENEVWANPIFANQQKHFSHDEHGQYRGLINRLISQYLQEEVDFDPFVQITALAVGETIGLVAIGTSDGRVLLFDTNSTKFMKQAIIYLPRDERPKVVTNILFLGEYPLFFVGTSSGACYIYTARPMVPGDLLLVSFQHASYNPVAYPLNLDYLGAQRGHINLIKYFISKFTRDTNEHLLEQRKYSDFIKMVCFTYDIFIKNEKNYFRGADSQLHRNYIQEKQQKDFIMQNMGLTATADSTTDGNNSTMRRTQLANTNNSGLSQFNNAKIVGFRRSIVFSRMEESTSVSHQSMSQSSTKDTDGAGYAGIDQDLVALTRELAMGSDPTVEQTSRFFRANKKRKGFLYKMRASVTTISLVQNLFLPFIGMQNRFKIADEVMAHYGEVIEDLHGEDDLDIQTDAPITQKIQEQVQLSDKSKDIIRKFIKTKGNQGQRKTVTIYHKWVTPQEQLEIHYEKQGLLLKYDYDPTTSGVIRVPIRKKILSNLNTQSAVQASLYNPQRNHLLVGDADGFMTKYDVSQLIRLVKPQEVALMKKQVLDVQSGKPQDIIIGFVPQKTEYTAVGLGTPIFRSKDVVQIVYQCRVHETGVLQMHALQGDSVVTIGQDKRVLIWNTKAMTLQGQLQRVILDKAEAGWEKLFATDIFSQQPHLLQSKQQTQLAKTTHTNTPKTSTKLTVGDLSGTQGTDQLGLYYPPAQRLECPPAAEYTWDYLPAIQYQSSCMSVNQSLSQSIGDAQKQMTVIGKSTGIDPLEATKTVLAQQIPVPTLDTNENSNLLKVTGLNPQIFNKNKSSWTVRALVGKITAGRVDSSLDDAKKQLLTECPKTTAENDVSDDDEIIQQATQE